jgi:hypothetical protein
MTPMRVVSSSLRIALLCLLFAVTFIAAASAVSVAIPPTPAEPGPVSEGAGLAIVVVANTLLIAALILASRWGGWKLALLLAASYYGLVTFIMQIETWYFLSGLTVGPGLLPRLFVMGLPPAFVFIPIAVWVLGKGRAQPDLGPNPALVMPARQWAWKLAAIALVYVALYWSAGYFIAWQNPELRAFYGQAGAPLSFWAMLTDDPWLIPFQVLRSLLWTLFALPLIRGSKLNAGLTALLVGLALSVPQNIGHILPNPLIPIASVRLSHLIETASSTFVFGLVIVWLLHRAHGSLRDLFGLPARAEGRGATPPTPSGMAGAGD